MWIIMGSVYKRDRFWYIDLYVKGRRIRKKVGTSKQIAMLALKDAEVKAARDEFGFTKNDISLDRFLRSGPGLLDSLAALLRWIRFDSLCRLDLNIGLHRCLVT